MKFLLLIMVDKNYRPNEPVGDVTKWYNELNDAGKYVIGDRVEPSARAKVVRLRDGETIISDGSVYTQPEAIIGFDVIEADDSNHAVTIAARHPMAAAGIIEVRSFWPFEAN